MEYVSDIDHKFVRRLSLEFCSRVSMLLHLSSKFTRKSKVKP